MTAESPSEEYIVNYMSHRSPGYGNEVRVVVQAPTDEAVERGVKDYLSQWHPLGYNTRVSARYKCDEGHRAEITRLASCD